MKGFITGMRFVLRYGAYALVIFDIIEYAANKFEALDNKKADNNAE